jgi:hypothetical protein
VGNSRKTLFYPHRLPRGKARLRSGRQLAQTCPLEYGKHRHDQGDINQQVIAQNRDSRLLYNHHHGRQENPAEIGGKQPGAVVARLPVLTVDIRVGDRVLSLFSTLSQFGTALDVGTQEILIESYFPANVESRAFFTANADND